MGMALPPAGSESQTSHTYRSGLWLMPRQLVTSVNPDQLLAAYAAARAKSSADTAGPAPAGGPSAYHLQVTDDAGARQSVVSDASVYSNAGPTDSVRK